MSSPEAGSVAVSTTQGADELVNFPLFPHFPYELRRQIIEDAIEDLDQRTFVVVSESMVVTERRKQMLYSTRKDLISATRYPVPSLLQVNMEFRAGALKVYRLSFCGSLSKKPIYFNFSKDELLFGSHVSLQAMKNSSSCSAWEKIERDLRHLGVSERFDTDENSLDVVAKFHKLDVFASPRHDEGPNSTYRQDGDSRLKVVLDQNWNASHDFEELVDATWREASLSPEPALEKAYDPPRIKLLGRKEIKDLVGRV